MCGGTSGNQILAVGVKGLSPRVRGNLIDGIQGLPERRSIPACAGEPSLRRPLS